MKFSLLLLFILGAHVLSEPCDHVLAGCLRVLEKANCCAEFSAQIAVGSGAGACKSVVAKRDIGKLFICLYYYIRITCNI